MVEIKLQKCKTSRVKKHANFPEDRERVSSASKTTQSSRKYPYSFRNQGKWFFAHFAGAVSFQKCA
jgi:hypothetical protein